ncbi:sensor histidine kinase [Flavobacterium sp.]|uniref:sensor histidine kinase n=1 Tax=Flavobacterium sp. TaxID=239 RepID=UPI0039E4142B
MKNDRLTQIKITFILAAVLLLSLSVYSYVRIKNLMQSSAWVNHTANVKFELESFFSTTKDLESAMRGFLLTKDSLHYREFNTYLDRVDDHYRSLRLITKDNYSQRANLHKLEKIATERIDNMKSVLSIGEMNFVVVQRRPEFRETRAQLRRQIDKMMDEEDMLLRIRKKSLIKESSLTPMFAALLTVCSILVLIASYYQINKELKTSNLLREDLEDKNESLEKMNQELESFTYISSHDLQEPLRKIQTFISILIEKESDHLSETAHNYLKRSQDSAHRMQNLIRDLLAYSRLSAEVFPTETVNLQTLVTEISHDFEEEIEGKKVEIEVTGHPEIKIIVSQFRQLLINLISNSIKFSQPDLAPHITIDSQIVKGNRVKIEGINPETTYAQVTFSDNGIGFEPQYNDRIFKVFQRLHIDQQYKGTGIGLAIVKKIVDNHQGLITANGEINKGATFTIYLPA